MRISDWSSDVCSSDLFARAHGAPVDKMTEDQRMAMIMKLCVRHADARIIGTPQQVAERLQDIKAAGIDGVLLGFLDYAEEIPFSRSEERSAGIECGSRC